MLVKGFLNSKQENNFGNVFLHLNQLELITLKPKKLFVSENDALITGFEKFYNVLDTLFQTNTFIIIV